MLILDYLHNFHKNLKDSQKILEMSQNQKTKLSFDVILNFLY